MIVPIAVASRPTDSEVRAPHTMREKVSQPWNVKPRMCPAVGPPLLLDSWQSLSGGTCVNRVGNAAIRITMAMTTRAIQNVGRRRRSRHASSHRLLLRAATRTASTEMVSVLIGAT